LVNNIAWALRRFPAFAIFGDGAYKLQPIYVEDLAELAVAAAKSTENLVQNAIGPETFTYRELVEAAQTAIGMRRLILNVPADLGYILGRIIGCFMRDKFITREEIQGLMEGRLHVQTTPTGHTRLTDWMHTHAETLGRHYANELKRRRDRSTAYLPRGSDR